MTSSSRPLLPGARGRRSGALGILVVALALGGCGASTSSEVNQVVGETARVAHAVTQLSENAMRSWCPAAVADDGQRLTQVEARECLRRAWNGWLRELKRNGYDPNKVSEGQ